MRGKCTQRLELLIGYIGKNKFQALVVLGICWEVRNANLLVRYRKPF